jgi:NAD(P) transhydrogenase subunit alpha
MIDLGLIGDLYVFVLAGFLGYQLISRVSPLLHTPLMSATNAISGISLVGSLVVAGAGYGKVSTALGFIAVTASTINVVGGFLITDRILKMFRAGGAGSAGDGRSPQGAASGEGSNAKGAASGGK